MIRIMRRLWKMRILSISLAAIQVIYITTMKDSLVWEAAQKAWARGAVYAGCSAGAMILGTEMPDVRAAGIRSTAAFGILPIASLHAAL